MSNSKVTVTLELNREQADMLMLACEFYSRMRMGQWGQLAYQAMWWNRELAVENREVVEGFMMVARRLVYPDLWGPGHSYGVGKFRDGDLAWEIYEVVRHALAWHDYPQGGHTVNFVKPMCFSGVELPKCEVR